MYESARYRCVVCGDTALRLSEEEHQLVCAGCGTSFAVVDNVPVLLPPSNRRTNLGADESIALEELQAVYDRAYARDGIMGTDYDRTYDASTKAVLLEFAGIGSGMSLLDVGTGVGRLWDYIHSDVDGYALDPSLLGVKAAKSRHPALTASVSIAEYIPYVDAQMDAVIAADTLEHTYSPEQTLREIFRVLKPGGVLAASFPVPNSLRKWGWNFLRHERKDLRLVFGLLKVVIHRTLLFGRPDFQPIDRDYELELWLRLMRESGFMIEVTRPWPEPPRLALVWLVKAVKPGG